MTLCSLVDTTVVGELLLPSAGYKECVDSKIAFVVEHFVWKAYRKTDGKASYSVRPYPSGTALNCVGTLA